jgi:hypothetical protein
MVSADHQPMEISGGVERDPPVFWLKHIDRNQYRSSPSAFWSQAKASQKKNYTAKQKMVFLLGRVYSSFFLIIELE